MLTASITRRLTKLLRFERAAPGGPAKAGRRRVGVALCTLALIALVPAAAPAAAPVHEVKGSATFWLDVGDGPDGFNLVQHYSFNATLDEDGSAHGLIETVTNWIYPEVPPKGQPDPYGTGGQARWEVTKLVVTDNVACIAAVLIFAPDFPELLGTTDYFDVVDVGDPPNSGDLVDFDGFGPLVTLAGNISVR